MRHQGIATLVLVLIATALAAIVPSSAAAKPPGNEPCGGQKSYGWMGDWETRQIQFPSLTRPDGIDNYQGIIRRPRDLIAYPGKRPVVFLQHGRGGNECGLSWMARDLAGHGFVTVTWRSPGGGSAGQAFANALDATRSAVSWARGPSNPFLALSDQNRTAIGGHSLGSIVASLLQGEQALGFDAAIALDTLRHWVTGDPAAASECDGPPAFPVTPRVPALGFAMDKPCKERRDFRPQDLKLSGFLHWRQKEVPSMQLVMKGYGHPDFAGGGTKRQQKVLSHYTRSWLDRWVQRDKGAVQPLLAKVVLGTPTPELLSTQFFSGAYIPGVVNVTNYRDYSLRDHSIPNTKKLGGPDGGRKVKRKKVQRVGIRFRWRADKPEAGTRSWCKLDKEKWRSCSSPKKIEKRLSKGKHEFRVRLVDPAGNKEPKPAKWVFRVK